MLELYTDDKLMVEIEIADLTDEELAEAINRHLEDGPNNSYKTTGHVI